MDATNSFELNGTAEANAARPASLDYASIAAAPSYDEPYRFGRRPNSRAPFPFTEREFARLLIVRSRIDSQTTSPLSATEA
ncbi:MAG: hypothetical protein JO020_11195 [Chloroflexi bacterium]|nr:hypothetical protein [Chloroflexota bacterium]MBV9133727.1 hypothetical protein [Chloroflexota bacterium]MBV9894727.1 hypothetical protein [Chloroflexota bacterium]